MERHAEDVNWVLISHYQTLSESFIEKYADKVDWYYIPECQHLSEDFMGRHADKVDWTWISAYQKLSENFIEKYADKVDWEYISMYQHLSEAFIKKYADKVDWRRISKYQSLSEAFIEKHADKVNWEFISKYQKLSDAFISRHFDIINIMAANDSWLNKTAEFKKKKIEATGLYECHEDFFYAYKGIRSDRYSAFNFQYQYLPGETYECFADGSDEESSFGFSVWTKEEAKNYCNKLVVKCKIYYKDIARVIYYGGKIRCSRITILE